MPSPASKSGVPRAIEIALEVAIRRAYTAPVVPPVEGENSEVVRDLAVAALISSPDRMRHLAAIQTAAIDSVAAALPALQSHLKEGLLSDAVVDAVAEANAIRELYGHWNDGIDFPGREENQRRRYAQLAKKPGVQESYKDAVRREIEQLFAALDSLQLPTGEEAEGPKCREDFADLDVPPCPGCPDCQPPTGSDEGSGDVPAGIKDRLEEVAGDLEVRGAKSKSDRGSGAFFASAIAIRQAFNLPDPFIDAAALSQPDEGSGAGR